MKVRAFTLVELLVVIGIIALLISILLPTLSTARQAANTAVCASNIRQLATASLLYAIENHGYFPPAHLDFLTTNLDRWHGTRPNTSAPFDFSTSRLRRYLYTPNIKQCPAFEPAAPGFEASAGGYGYNNHYIGSSTADQGWSTDSVNTPAKLNMIRNPSSKILFADTAMAVGSTIIEYSFAEPPTADGLTTSPSLQFRHRNRCNIAFADGHVTAELFQWTYPTNAYGSDNTKFHLGFFGPQDNSLFQRQ
ncbi:MAG TPA: prepilin-type N-terminal cleavage/methylation domain-containing protein [Tepidisphaeraceae bacterium]|jgi:prepilin-type processing-associated H-X9-DG protein/prepilin-type N-terminal cleavage/methylation domain-containing protein|nr:prepilin-type N-terminal cleavage/methylation domain-containing protein [Tepidisphaeraceae bacterium]